MKDNSAVYR